MVVYPFWSSDMGCRRRPTTRKHRLRSPWRHTSYTNLRSLSSLLDQIPVRIFNMQSYNRFRTVLNLKVVAYFKTAVSKGYTFPSGLLGLLKIIAFVLSENLLSSSSGSSLKSLLLTSSPVTVCQHETKYDSTNSIVYTFCETSPIATASEIYIPVEEERIQVFRQPPLPLVHSSQRTAL